ncbi:MAG: hypothetical protein HY958_08515 [Bacteroidia bacterium]|nr:hypothetical protein [Bacteroidia bacterium]
MGTGDSIVVYPAGTTTYYARAEGACGTTACVSLLIKPTGIVPVSVNIFANDTTVCSGTSVTYTATSANGGTNPVYQWYLNGNPVGADSSEYSNPNINNGDSIYLIFPINLYTTSKN